MFSVTPRNFEAEAEPARSSPSARHAPVTGVGLFLMVVAVWGVDVSDKCVNNNNLHLCEDMKDMYFP